MRNNRYGIRRGCRLRQIMAAAALAAFTIIPSVIMAEEPELPPIDPIWNKAKIEPERKPKKGVPVHNTATRATVSTSRDSDKSEVPATNIRKNEKPRQTAKPAETSAQTSTSAPAETVNFDAGKAEDSPTVTVIRAQDFPEYMKKAQAGDTEGMRVVGICYLYGTGTDKDARKAWDWLGKAASAGNTEAQYDLGCLYRDGMGVKQNSTESAYWFRRAARNGNAKAMVNIARQFAEGNGVLQDYRIAAENYWRAAERGEPEGMYQYAVMLRDGVGVQQDNVKALRWFREAASHDYKDASLQADELQKTVKASPKSSKASVSKVSKASHKTAKATTQKRKNRR